jgi:hypothetical protein
MAYILGFWFTDGWITKRRFGIIQHKRDKYILEQMLMVMKSDYKLYKSKHHNCCSIEICSNEIIKDIKKLGGKERKSLIMRFPKVPKKYLPDFIRGLWDGDGCVTYCGGAKCYRSNYTCGSKKFIYKMFSILHREIKGLNGFVYRTRPNVYVIMFGKNDTIRLRDYIYGKGKSKLKLIRKLNKFDNAGEVCKIGREKKEFLSYCKARDTISKVGLRSVLEWYAYSSTLRPQNIPCNPKDYYKNKGWTNWYDWLGKRKVSD